MQTPASWASRTAGMAGLGPNWGCLRQPAHRKLKNKETNAAFGSQKCTNKNVNNQKMPKKKPNPNPNNNVTLSLTLCFMLPYVKPFFSNLRFRVQKRNQHPKWRVTGSKAKRGFCNFGSKKISKWCATASHYKWHQVHSCLSWHGLGAHPKFSQNVKIHHEFQWKCSHTRQIHLHHPPHLQFWRGLGFLPSTGQRNRVWDTWWDINGSGRAD